jgi:PAS domain S-box-containing protein
MDEKAKSVSSLVTSFAPTGKLAEETLQAIVLGEADAIVVETNDGPRVYTLRDASEPYRELVERMPGVATVLDDDHTILYCNGGLPRMLGREGLAGHDFLDLVAPHQRELAGALLKAAEKAQSNAELALISTEGVSIEVRASAAPMSFDGQPCVALMVMSLDDIDALKLSAADLRESERRFQTALANSPIAVFEQDLNLRYTWIYNPKLGYRVDEVIGRSDADVMDPSCVAGLTEIKSRVIATGQPTREEVAVAAPGAPLEYYDLFVEPRRDEAGKTIGVICAATDITERKLAAETLRKNEARNAQLAAIVNASSDAILSIGLDFVVRTWNAGAVALFGYTEDEAIGRHLDDLILPPEIRGAPPEYYGAIVAEQKAVLVEAIRHRKDGSLVSVEINAAPVLDNVGKSVAISVMIRDISERKLTEEKVGLLMHEVEHRSKNMLATVRAIGHLVQAVSVEEFRKQFDERLGALNANHTALLANDWHGIEIDTLVRAQLAHLSDFVSGKLTIGGPPCLVKPATAQALGMTLHELGTNSAKYGALSNVSGWVKLSWTLHDGEAGRRFTITWTEDKGQPIAAPKRTGFGSMVIRRMIASAVRGDVQFEFTPTGLNWRLECPLDAISGQKKPV